MSRQMIEVTIDTDVFKTRDRLTSAPGVTAHIVTMDQLRIYYHPEKVAEKEILSMIEACGRKNTNNILSIKRKTISNEQEESID